MQSLSTYKETIVFLSGATLLLGTVLVLQKATTPSRHRRRANLSASRAGTVTRSASHGAAGARSRSSSRLRVGHTSHGHSSAAPTSATAIDRSHAAKSREVSQAHSHRHHTHPRNGGVAVVTADSRIEGSDATAAPKLTLEAITQHKKTLGTANALQDPRGRDLAGTHASRRGVSSSGYRANGGSGAVEDAAYYRTASNAATVGSQAPCPTPVTAVGTEVVPPVATNAVGVMNPPLALSPQEDAECPRACVEGSGTCPKVVLDRHAAPQSTTITSRMVSMTPEAAAPAPVKAQPSSPQMRASTTQTNPRWFHEDRGTQTETSATQAVIQPTASATPERWLSGAMISPIMPSGENVSDSMLINCADLGWTPSCDGAPSIRVAHADRISCEHTQPPMRNRVESVVIPRYFLQQLEWQLRLLVQDVAQDELNEQAWMCLYTYLSELPLAVRTSLTLRDRCGAATIAQLVGKITRNTLTEGNLVEETVAMPSKAANQDPIFSLRREVLHLLQHSTAIEPEFHFEWKGSTVAYAKGPLRAASKEARKAAVAGNGEVDNFAHARISSSSLSSTSVALTDDEEEESLRDDAETMCTSRLLSFIAAHIKKYSHLRLRGVATQCPEPGMEEPRTPSDATGHAQQEAYALATPPPNRWSDADAALQQQFRDQQDQLSLLLASFVRLRHTPLFQALRHTSQHALFACDFIELTSEAERLLERASPSSVATRLPEVPMTEKRVVNEVMDARDTSVGTNTSVGLGSSPGTGPTARTSVKVRTPMKPSIRYPIQRTLSNMPSPSGLASRRSTQNPDMYKQLYSPAVRIGKEAHEGVVSSATV